jgi:hypothetical protein
VAAALVLAVVAHRRLPGLERAVLAFAERHGMPGTSPRAARRDRVRIRARRDHVASEPAVPT